MKLTPELSISAVNDKRQSSGRGATPVSEAHVLHATPETEAIACMDTAITPAQEQEITRPAGFILPFDPLRGLDALWKNIKPCLIGGAVCGVLLFAAARFRIEPHYTASAQLMKQSMPDSFRASQNGESYKPRDIPVPILTNNLMQSRALLERVGKLTNPPTSADTLMRALVVGMDRKTEVITASITSNVSAARAVEIVTHYADEVVRFTKDLHRQDASEVNDFLKKQLVRCDKEMIVVNDELLRYAREANILDGEKEMDAYLGERANFDLKYSSTRLDYDTLDLRIQAAERELAKVSPAAAKLQRAREELAVLLDRYTEQNPIVETQRDRIKTIEEELTNSEQTPHEATPPQAGENPVAVSMYLQRVELMTQKGVLAEQLKKLDALRLSLNEKLEQLPRKNFEYAIIKARRQSLETARQLLASRQREAELFLENSLGYYRVIQRPDTVDAVVDRRSSKKLIMGAVGVALGFISLAAWFVFRELRDGRVRTQADLRRVTRLPVLAALPDEAAKDSAAQNAWAFRTWTRLHSKLKLPDSALVCGLLAENETEHCSVISRLLADAAAWRGAAVLVVTNKAAEGRAVMPLESALTKSLEDADRWLSTCSGVVFLEASEAWSWNASQRAQLDRALRLWSRNQQAVVFVELPPATQPETLLMAERLPQILWIGASGQRPGSTLHETLATYRHAGCKLLGAMLNRAPSLKPSILNQFAGATLLAFMACTVARAGSETSSLAPPKQVGAASPAPAPARDPSLPSLAPMEEPAPAPNTVPAAKAARGLPLGAGDSLNISFFGRPELTRTGLVVKSDGGITYLQAQDVQAAGLTIDELRARLNSELRKYYASAHVIITPASFQSRKVYLLGKVVKKGIVVMDRPLTILEAVTDAGGLETGIFQQNTVELADLARSFLARGQKRVKVDFEALFNRGDMSQNLLLEPDDYLYFPSSNSNEIYVVGNVKNQGSQGLLANTTITSAVTLAGGFGPKAWQSRVLVIRGSLDKPQAIAVDVDDILHAKAVNFRLEPKDIIFVSDRPWARVEEVVDMAITSFLAGAIGTYTTQRIAPLFNKPFNR